MMPRLRQLMLTLHVTSSVGFLGAVAAFLSLAVAGLAGRDPRAATAAYLSMASITSSVIVPLCIASLLTGTIQSLGTPWGLLRHYWVVVKLLLTIAATFVLWQHLQPIELMARAAEHTALSDADLRGVRAQLVIASGAGLLLLFVTTALSIYKPRGMTRYGWRKQNEQSPS